jgi:hypothetical protein
MTRATHSIRLAACIPLFALLTTAAVHSQSSEPHLQLPVDVLKHVYLACEREAAKGNLDTSEIMQCSVLYEELKRRAFYGNFKLLKTWADTQIVAEGY